MISSINKRPFVVVLTGGIGSGKTAVSDRFGQLGVPVVDTDIIAREIVEPGQPALQKIIEVFGKHILNKAGELDRKAMRELVFSDSASKSQLEQILHPAIRAEAMHQVQLSRAPYCIVVVPLLAESGSFQWTDRVLVVDVDESTQIRRVMTRDQINSSQANAILKAQASRQQRIEIADDIIENSGKVEDLEKSILTLHVKYTAMSQAHQTDGSS
jgi:dephospho-CoA kinase